jgi:hypothetical protein
MQLNIGQRRTLAEKYGFMQFVENSGYPKPYQKQKDAYDFVFVNPWRSQVKMLLGSRGTGKTDYITIQGSSYEVYKNPHFTILIATKERGRGAEIIQECREVLISNGVRPKNRSQSSIILKDHVGKDPNMISKSVRSKGTRGRHPDMVIMDDPITPDDTSPAERRRVKIFYDEALKLSKRILIIGQPVHKLDLYQELRGLVEVFEIIHGDIPELDADLDAQRAAGVSEKSIQASYFLKIEDDLSMPFLKIEAVNYFPQGSTVAFIDPANKGGNGRDFTAISIGRMHFEHFVSVGFAFPKAWEDCLEEFGIIFKMFHVKQTHFATTMLGEEPAKRMTQMGMPTRPYIERGNKHGRIMRMALHRENIKLTKVSGMGAAMQQANEKYIELIRQYEYNSEHDDPPDSLSSLMEVVGLIHKGAHHGI